MSVEEAWQAPKLRRPRRRRSPSKNEGRFFGSRWQGSSEGGGGRKAGGDGDLSDALSDDFSLVDGGEAYEDDGVSFCDDRDSLEEWDFVDHGVVSRLVESSLSWVDAALRGFTGEFKNRAADSVEARKAKSADVLKIRDAARAERRLARRLALAEDRENIQSEDEELQAAVSISRDFKRRTRRSKSALFCKSKSLLKKSAAGRPSS